MENLAGPIVIEMHVAAGGKKKRGMGEANQPPEAQNENAYE
jgi:hypothetical protein